MPLKSYPGLDIADLEVAVADVERTRGRVVQVVGNIGGAWWLLVEKPSRKPQTGKETR